MLKFLTTAGALFGALAWVAPASAADMAVKASAPVAAGYNWSGLYLGANIGWAHAESNGSNSVPCEAACVYFFPGNATRINANGGFGTSADGFTGGAQLGYNIQKGVAVYGIEGDFNWLNTSSTATRNLRYVTAPLNGNVFTNTTEANWLATIRGRLGFTTGPALLYVTGGAAFAEFKLSSSVIEDVDGIAFCPICDAGRSSSRNIRAGWTAGAGLEWALNRNWSVKGEYLYAAFGKIRSTTNYVGDGVGPGLVQVINHSADLSLQVARLGLNYRF